MTCKILPERIVDKFFLDMQSLLNYSLYDIQSDIWSDSPGYLGWAVIIETDELCFRNICRSEEKKNTAIFLSRSTSTTEIVLVNQNSSSHIPIFLTAKVFWSDENQLMKKDTLNS